MQTKAKINYSLIKIICANKIYFICVSPDVFRPEITRHEVDDNCMKLKLIMGEPAVVW